MEDRILVICPSFTRPRGHGRQNTCYMPIIYFFRGHDEQNFRASYSLSTDGRKCPYMKSISVKKAGCGKDECSAEMVLQDGSAEMVLHRNWLFYFYGK